MRPSCSGPRARLLQRVQRLALLREMALQRFADVSDGLEPRPIPLEGAPKPDFVYVAAPVLPDGAELVHEGAEGCACEDDCSTDCECIEEYGASASPDVR